MQKKLIALAVAGLASSAAFAQSNVTIYGVMDANISSVNAGKGSKFTVGSGGLSSSRLGFKGEEDLGNGLKAVFQIESGFMFDTGNAGAAAQAKGFNQSNGSGAQTDGGSQFWSRQAYAGLKGGFGGVTFGRQYTSSYNAAAGVADVWGAGLFGQSAQLLPAVGMPTRVNNSIAYVTPTMSGFSAQFTWTTGNENNVNVDSSAAATACTGASTACTNDKAGRGYDLGLNYSNGPIVAVLTNWNVRQATFDQTLGETGLGKKKGWSLSANYNFGPAKVHGSYVSGKFDWEGTRADSKMNGWSLGVSAPFGKSTVGLSYASLNDKSVTNADATTYGIGYTYSMSKRTTAYASWGKVRNKDTAAFNLLDSGGYQAGGVAAGYDPRGYMAGFRHTF